MRLLWEWERWRPRFDPDRAAEVAGVQVSYDFPLDRLLGLYARDEDGYGYVALRPDLRQPSHERLRRVVLAHELAHHSLHAGIYVGPFQCRQADLATSHAEMQAERWAAEKLCPVRLVHAVMWNEGRIDREEMERLAEVVRVPDAFIVWWLGDLKERGLLMPRRFR